MSPLIIGMASFVIIFPFVVFIIYKANFSEWGTRFNISKEAIEGANGFSIPVRQSGSTVGKTSIGFSHNNVNPFLTLFHDHMEYRVLRKGSLNYGNIEAIDVTGLLRPATVIIYRKAESFHLTFELGNVSNAQELLKFFDSKKIPLTDKARGVLSLPNRNTYEKI